MAPAFDYLTQVLRYLLPGQAVFNGLPVNQQMLVSPNASFTSALAITEVNALYQVSCQPCETRSIAAIVGPTEPLAATMTMQLMLLTACISASRRQSRADAGRQVAGSKQREQPCGVWSTVL